MTKTKKLGWLWMAQVSNQGKIDSLNAYKLHQKHTIYMHGIIINGFEIRRKTILQTRIIKLLV